MNLDPQSPIDDPELLRKLEEQKARGDVRDKIADLSFLKEGFRARLDWQTHRIASGEKQAND
jgi:hypothetical protein